MAKVAIARNPTSDSIRNLCISNDIKLDTYRSSFSISLCWGVIDRLNNMIRDNMSPNDSSSDKAEESTKSEKKVSSLCELCGASFPRKADLKKHTKECFERNASSSSENVDGKTFLCDLCASFFENEEDLKKHDCKCPAPEGNSKDGVKRELRSKESRNDAQMPVHLLYGTQTKPKRKRTKGGHVFSCEFCGESFSTTDWCANELEHFYTYFQLPGVCDECNVAALDYYTFNQERDDFSCKRCGKNFSVVKFLKNHIIQHAQLANLVFRTECDKASSTSTFPLATDGSNEKFFGCSQPPPEASTSEDFLVAPFLADCEIKQEADPSPDFNQKSIFSAMNVPSLSAASEISSVYDALSAYGASMKIGRALNLTPTVDELLSYCPKNVAKKSTDKLGKNTTPSVSNNSVKVKPEFKPSPVAEMEAEGSDSSLPKDKGVKQYPFRRTRMSGRANAGPGHHSNSSRHTEEVNSSDSDGSADVQKRPKKKLTTKCEHCGKCFSTQQNCARHVRTVHKRGRPAKKPRECPQCGTVFYSKEAFDKHLRLHSELAENRGKPKVTSKNEQTCLLCGDSFESTVTFQKHPCKSVEPESIVNNANVKKILWTYKKLTGNVEEPEVYLCPRCKQPYKNELDFLNHMRAHLELDTFVREKALRESKRKPKKSASYACQRCGEPFKNESDLKSHLKTHFHLEATESHSPLSADSLSKALEKPEYALPIPAVICLLCGVLFEHKSDFQGHPCQNADVEKVVNYSNVRKCLATYRPPGRLEEPIVYMCPRCGKTYPQEPVFVSHILSHFELDTLVQDKTLKPKENSKVSGLACRRCGESFGNKTELESHQKTHFLFGAVAANRTLFRPSRSKNYTPEEPAVEWEPFSLWESYATGAQP